MNNCATIVKINSIRKHPNADKLQIVDLFGTQVIVDLGVNQGDLMIYFDSNLKLGNEYCSINNLYRTKELNKNKDKEGYIEDNGRVKAIKLRGQFSDGMLMPLSSVSMFNKKELEQGFEFNELGGVLICEKYVIKVKQSHGDTKKNTGRKTLKSPMFVEHWDTGQFFKESHRIPANTLCFIEEKIHGTSGRAGLLLSERKLKWYENVLIYLGVKINKFEYRYIHGSRRVAFVFETSKKGFHDNTMRDDVLKSIEGLLQKGQEIYFEIYGYEKTGAEIQKDFVYGCEPNKFKVLLYRVTMNNEDGNVVDYSREYVYKKAEELGMEKPHLFEVYHYDGTEESMKTLQDKVKDYAQGQSAIDDKTLKEGVVVWFINAKGNWEALKYKSDAFRLRESANKDKGIVDQEDVN